MVTLYGCKGCGSVVIEAMLKLCMASLSRKSAGISRTRQPGPSSPPISAQRQVPTLVLQDGTHDV